MNQSSCTITDGQITKTCTHTVQLYYNIRNETVCHLQGNGWSIVFTKISPSQENKHSVFFPTYGIQLQSSASIPVVRKEMRDDADEKET